MFEGGYNFISLDGFSSHSGFIKFSKFNSTSQFSFFLFRICAVDFCYLVHDNRRGTFGCKHLGLMLCLNNL